VFWDDSVKLFDATYVPIASLQGHLQTGDAYLLALAAKQKGRLATFDSAIASLPRTEIQREALVIIPTP
jgi:predicted nucleic acid-binding protein